MGKLHAETIGRGDQIVLVHGSLTTGAEEWQAQLPLADEGFRLVIPDRCGYGSSPVIDREDFLRDAEDLVELLDEGSHVVAHSYGGLSAMFAAVERPDSIQSLTLLEPPAFIAATGPAETLLTAVRTMWHLDLSDDEWLVRFLQAVGTAPDVIPPEAREEVVARVPLVRRGRPPWESHLPLSQLASAAFPKHVVSGGHSDGFEAICDKLARHIGASRSVVKGAGHDIQFTGPPLNDLLLRIWRTAPQTSTRIVQ
ncbi:alpha/beta fold hydrolase [Nesterenkonia muleiensis]|uniref:alpha/beta fold hydrolase n=1 Tax=Nesterenkonia muleiensis TaxID=2282648 RepID=UPI00130095BA|nr:alpha/beta fold hydrolase [Nesterenkonia muleiensis]